MAVRFLQSWRGYNAGEIAVFPHELESDLVRYGTAEWVTAVATEEVDQQVEDRAIEAPPVDRMIHSRRSRRK